MIPEKIKLKATKTAPELVTQGNLQAANVNGHFETDNRLFADFLIRAGYATEAVLEVPPAAVIPKLQEVPPAAVIPKLQEVPPAAAIPKLQEVPPAAAIPAIPAQSGQPFANQAGSQNTPPQTVVEQNTTGGTE